MSRPQISEIKKTILANRLNLVKEEYGLKKADIAKEPGVDEKNLQKVFKGQRAVTCILAETVNDMIDRNQNGIKEYLSGEAPTTEGFQSVPEAMDKDEQKDRIFIQYLIAAGHKIYFKASFPFLESFSGAGEMFYISPLLIKGLYPKSLESGYYNVSISGVTEEALVHGVYVDGKEMPLNCFWDMIDKAQIMTDCILCPDAEQYNDLQNRYYANSKQD